MGNPLRTAFKQLRAAPLPLQAVLLLTFLVVCNYWPVMFGKVPLSMDVVLNFPPWETMRGGKKILAAHAEQGDLVTQRYPWSPFAGESIRNGMFRCGTPTSSWGLRFWPIRSLPSSIQPMSSTTYFRRRLRGPWHSLLGSSGFRVGNRVVFFLPRTVGIAGGVSGHVEPRTWDHAPRRDRACHFDKLSAQPEPAEACPEPSRRACAELSRSGLALPNQASDPEKGAASSAPTIQIPH